MNKYNQRIIQTTKDGSSTIFLPDLQETYHSIYGALQESEYVFIQKGWEKIVSKTVNILEIGFGTALNAMLTLHFAHENHIKVNYFAIEAYPLTEKEVGALNYSSLDLWKKNTGYFDVLHSVPWDIKTLISPYFTLQKEFQKLSDFIPNKANIDLVYFDAFSPNVQPEMWTISVFKKMYTAMKFGGVLVTYCAKGAVRRALKEVGFEVERLQGPPGKREMLRAVKISLN